MAGKSRYTFEGVKQFIEVESGSGCLLVSTERDKRGHFHVNLICRCGEPFDTNFYYFKTRKRQCDYCSGVRHTIKSVRKVAEEKGCTVISETYKNNRTKMKFRCACGEPFTTTFKSLNQQDKTTCDNCTNNARSEYFSKSNEEFDEELLKIHSGDIVRLGDYKNKWEKVLVKHLECGNTWPANPGDLTSRKSGCPICRESHGEKRISRYLDSRDISYKRQYKIDACRNVRPLPFDFAIFDNGNLVMLIEFDGRQHFDKTCFGGKYYDKTVINDGIKNDYCLSNSIPLLRINYKELEITESILKDAIKI